MKKIILSFSLSIILAAIASAQSATDYKKYEVYGGFSHSQVDTGADKTNPVKASFPDRTPFNGFEAAGTYNVTRYVGIQGDISGTYRSRTANAIVPVGALPVATPVAIKTNNSLYNFLGGVQIKDNASETRFKPFGYALIGAGHTRTNVKSFTCPTGGNCSALVSNSDTGFAGAFGGGLDIKLTDKIDFRAIKADYNPIRFNGRTQQNVRLGVGIVFK